MKVVSSETGEFQKQNKTKQNNGFIIKISILGYTDKSINKVMQCKQMFVTVVCVLFIKYK